MFLVVYSPISCLESAIARFFELSNYTMCLGLYEFIGVTAI